RFKGKIPLLNLAADFTRPETKSTKGAYVGFEIEAQTAEKLRDLAGKKDATMFMAALTLFNILLFKLTTQEDIIIGTVTAGRRQRDLENIVGMFINTLPLRNFPQGKKSFIDFLEEIRETTLEAFDNEDYQFEDLVEKVLEKRDPTRNPLFDVLFAYGQLDLVDIRQEVSDYAAQPGKPGAAEPGQDVLRVEPYNREGAVSKFDMIFSGTDDGEKLFFSINYCTAIFKEETARRWAKYFAEIATAAAENEQVLLKDITISHDLVTATSEVYRDQESDFEF
ncbi:MAG: condensation domain-containing protein, partial [Candidatus Aminicenantes bacterium]|nr:condensation domain-containing protein [Candidatus Aminicenantes bacterium]